MKRIRNILYFILAIWVLNVPLQASAAERDAVTLSQDGALVSVLLDMSDATEESITAVSVSLEINAGGRDLVTADFEFSPELSNAECGFYYSEGSDNLGKLDIYAVTGSAKSLFNGNELNLGYLKVTPKNASQVLSITISYCGGSFQTANVAYGDKMPMVERVSDPINMQVGKGVIYDTSQKEENGTGPDSAGTSQGNGSQQTGSGQIDAGQDDQNGQSVGTGDDNMNQGLYDETVQFANDPGAAQKISSPVIKNSNLFTGLADLSAGAADLSGKPAAGSSGAAQPSQAKTKGKVSVVAPENGPSSIFVSQAEGGDYGVGGTEGGSADGAGESGIYGVEGAGGGAGGADEGEGGEEIKLDQKNGGVVSEAKGLDKGKLIMIGAIAAVVIILGVSAFFLFGRKEDNDSKKKPAKKKKKYPKKKRRKKLRN